MNPPSDVSRDECIGFSRSAQKESQAKNTSRIHARMECALFRSRDGRRISMDRISAARDVGAIDELVCIAANRHKDSGSRFKGWFAVRVSELLSYRQMRLKVEATCEPTNRFHSEIIFPEDMTENATQRKIFLERLLDLMGRWKSKEEVTAA